MSKGFSKQSLNNMKNGQTIFCPCCKKKTFAYKGKTDITHEDQFVCKNCGFNGVANDGPSLGQLLSGKSKKTMALDYKKYLKADLKLLESDLKILWKEPKDANWRKIKIDILNQYKKFLKQCKV